MSDFCFLCERNPITWPGTGMCEQCHQETAELEYAAEHDAISRLMREQGVDFIEAVEWLAVERGVWKP